MSASTSIRIIGTVRDQSVVPNPQVRYRPVAISGKRYIVRVDPPAPTDDTRT